MYEALVKPLNGPRKIHAPISRHSSSISANSRIVIPENTEVDVILLGSNSNCYLNLAV